MRILVTITSLILLSGCDSTKDEAARAAEAAEAAAKSAAAWSRTKTSTYDAGYNQADADYVSSIGMSPEEARATERAAAAGGYTETSTYDARIAVAEANLNEAYNRVEADKAALREIDAKIASLQ